MSLRDELARRLAEVRMGAASKIEKAWALAPERIPARAFLDVEKVVADECLRQMEWARGEALSDPDFDASETDWEAWVANGLYSDLTIAPNDWQPSPKNEEKSGGGL